MDALPDSRLRTKKGTVHAVWRINGKSVRVELEPVFCANCGVPHGYVPVENTTFACWFCERCAETWGGVASGCMIPDAEFHRKVEGAMLTHFRRVLTAEEIGRLQAQGWGPLKSLVRESPYLGRA